MDRKNGLLADRHAFDLFGQGPPVLRLEFGVLDPFLAPILMQPTDVVLRGLEEVELVPDALLDEDAPRVLGHDGLLILEGFGWRWVSLVIY